MSQTDDGTFGDAGGTARESGLEDGPAGPGFTLPRTAQPTARAGAAGARRRIAVTVEREIVPRLVETARSGHDAAHLLAESERLVALILCDDGAGARALLRDAHARGAGPELLQAAILAPAARRLGVLWEDDACDFAAVCLGVRDLQGLMREFRARSPAAPSGGGGRRILLAAAPGEHHVFGIEMVAEAFVCAGWEVVCRPSASHAELVRIATGDWFDVAGFSLAAERHGRALADAIRAVRRVSLNPGLWVVAGGSAVGVAPEVIAGVGADWIATDVGAAIVHAGIIAAP